MLASSAPLMNPLPRLPPRYPCCGMKKAAIPKDGGFIADASGAAYSWMASTAMSMVTSSPT